MGRTGCNRQRLLQRHHPAMSLAAHSSPRSLLLPAPQCDRQPTWRDVIAAFASCAPQFTVYLRLGTLLMPDNSGGEVTSEFVHSTLSIMSLYSDAHEAACGGAFVHYKIEKRGGAAVRGMSESLLEGLRRLELLVEMIADRTIGIERKLPLLMALEFVKAACHISLSLQGRELPARGKRLGFQRTRFLQWLLHYELSRKSKRRWIVGSVVHALRHLVYLAAIQKFGAKSWIPWILSLLVDLAAHSIASNQLPNAKTLSRGHQHTQPTETEQPNQEPLVSVPTRPDSPVQDSQPAEDIRVRNDEDGGSEEKRSRIDNEGKLMAWGSVKDVEQEMREEIQRRRVLLLLYLLRPPAFHIFLEPFVRFLQRLLLRVPILGSMFGLILDMLLTLGRYNFYHSGT